MLLYITCKDKKEATKISNHLLKRRLIACANIFPISSLYWWKGKIVKDKESVLIAKSLNKHFNKIQKEVKKIHSYEVPCITKINSKSNKAYEKWTREVC